MAVGLAIAQLGQAIFAGRGGLQATPGGHAGAAYTTKHWPGVSSWIVRLLPSAIPGGQLASACGDGGLQVIGRGGHWMSIVAVQVLSVGFCQTRQVVVGAAWGVGAAWTTSVVGLVCLIGGTGLVGSGVASGRGGLVIGTMGSGAAGSVVVTGTGARLERSDRTQAGASARVTTSGAANRVRGRREDMRRNVSEGGTRRNGGRGGAHVAAGAPADGVGGPQVPDPGGAGGGLLGSLGVTTASLSLEQLAARLAAAEGGDRAVGARLFAEREAAAIARRGGAALAFRYLLAELAHVLDHSTDYDDDAPRERYSALLDEFGRDPERLAAIRVLGARLHQLERDGTLPRSMVVRTRRDDHLP